jgi:23S rRNA pseudouridine1911/1915/1917 synthase
MLNIIFEDKYLVAINKPPGLLVVPSPKAEKYTLTSLVNNIFSERGLQEKAYPCHRIDKDTSGIVLFAKDKDTEAKMFIQFKERRVKKRYIALVTGHPEKPYGTINKRIEGMDAVTKYQVVKKMSGYSILELLPITGRTNQIRIHLKSIGHPILGERKFAFGKDFKVKFRRAALHARELSFIHPVTGKHVNIKASIPEDIKKMM